MVNDLLEGIHLVASVEAIFLGVRSGIHPAILYDIISNAAGSSRWFNRVYNFTVFIILFCCIDVVWYPFDLQERQDGYFITVCMPSLKNIKWSIRHCHNLLQAARPRSICIKAKKKSYTIITIKINDFHHEKSR